MENYIPYQKCPKCDGQGIVSKPSHIAGDVNQWTSADTSYTCDICQGNKIIPMHKVESDRGFDAFREWDNEDDQYWNCYLT